MLTNIFYGLLICGSNNERDRDVGLCLIVCWSYNYSGLLQSGSGCGDRLPSCTFYSFFILKKARKQSFLVTVTMRGKILELTVILKTSRHHTQCLCFAIITIDEALVWAMIKTKIHYLIHSIKRKLVFFYKLNHSFRVYLSWFLKF